MPVKSPKRRRQPRTRPSSLAPDCSATIDIPHCSYLLLVHTNGLHLQPRPCTRFQDRRNRDEANHNVLLLVQKFPCMSLLPDSIPYSFSDSTSLGSHPYSENFSASSSFGNRTSLDSSPPDPLVDSSPFRSTYAYVPRGPTSNFPFA